MNMVTPTTDQLVQVWAFVCSWIQEKVEHDMPASIPGFGTVLVIAHSHNIRIPHCVIHHAFANKYGLDTDADGSFQASSALEYRDIAVNCNIQEYTAKSWLEHILDNIGSHMRTQPLVELSLGVGILTCKNRYVDGHLMQKQPVEAEAPPVEPKKQTQPHPRSLVASSNTFTSYIVPPDSQSAPPLLHIPTKPSSPTTSLLDKDAHPSPRRMRMVSDKANMSPRVVLRQKLLSRTDETPTTVLAMPWAFVPNQADRVDTVKQLDAKYPPLLDPFCRTLGVEQGDGASKLTSSDRIGTNYSLAASQLVMRKHTSHHGHGLVFLEDESNRAAELEVTLRPPSPTHDKVPLPLVTTSGKPVYAPDGIPFYSRGLHEDDKRKTGVGSHPRDNNQGTDRDNDEETAVARYLHYLDKIINDNDIVPMNPSWTQRIQSLIARAVQRVGEKEALVAAMFHETHACYTYSIKKAILDYLLLRRETQLRLHILGGTPPAFQAQEKWKWGHMHAATIAVTPTWKERKARAEAHVRQFLMLIDTHVMALHYMWADYDSLLLVDLPSPSELAKQLTPLDVKTFEKRQIAHAAKVKALLLDRWFQKAKRILTGAKNDEVLDSALLHPKHYFECVATLMSLQLRRLIVRSIDAYVAYFEAFATPESTSSMQGLLLSLVLDQSKIKFDTSLEDVQLALLNVLYNIPSCLTHVDRVETKFEPSIILGGSPFLWSMGLHEAEVVHAAETIRKILQTNVAHATALRTTYSQYSMVASGDGALDVFVSQTHDIPAYAAEIVKFVDLASRIAMEPDIAPTKPGFGLFQIACKQLNTGLLQKASQFIQSLVHAFSEATLRLNRDIRQQFKLIAGRLARKPVDLYELVDAEAYLAKLRSHDLVVLDGNVQHVKQRVLFLFEQCTLVRDCPAVAGVVVSTDLLASTTKTFQWKDQIEKILRDGDLALQHERSRIETAFIAKRTRFQAELEELEAEVTSFQKKSDLRHATTYVVQLGKIRDAITHARHTIDVIADEEMKLGWVQTDFLQLDYICETLDPYDQLWRTARDFRESSVKWMRGNIFELDAKGTERLVQAMTTTLTNATKQLAATSPAAVGAAETLKKQIFEFNDSISIISVMGNASLRERHWTAIAETVGFIIDPAEHTTLQRLLDLGVQQSVARLLEISDAATNEAEIEASLDGMAEEWLHMEFKVVVSGDTFVLAENAVDDIHIKVEDHILRTQTIRCSQFRKPFFGRAVAWERSLLKLRDLTELLWETGSSWKKIAPLFAATETIHAILDKKTPEARKFEIVDSHWRSIMNAVVARPLCLAVIQIDKAPEKLRECLVLLEAILEGLTSCLEAKRALFSRFYLLSNAELIETLSLTPSRVKALTTGLLTRCFPGVGRVEMNSIYEITHVVSPMDEVVTLSQFVATEKVSPDVWLGRLELQIQTAVQVLVRNAINDYVKKDFRKWTSCWPEQVVLAVDMYMWTVHIESTLQDATNTDAAPATKPDVHQMKMQVDSENDDEDAMPEEPAESPSPTATPCSRLQAYFTSELMGHMNEIQTELKDGQTTRRRIQLLSNLLTQTLHARDVTADLLRDDVSNIEAFPWQSQIRFAWHDNNLHVNLFKASIPYGYEYVGNRAVHVMLPNTLKCARVVFSAVNLAKGTCVAGPASAGKSSTCRTIAATCAKLFVLFSCVAACSMNELTRLIKGVVVTGAWLCLDDVQNIVHHQLGVVLEMIQKLQESNFARESSLVLHGVKFRLKRGAHIMATFKPSGNHSNHLPVFFQRLFRRVNVVRPPLHLVAGVLFLAAGFAEAERLALLVEFMLAAVETILQSHGEIDNVGRFSILPLLVSKAKASLASEQTMAVHPNKLTIEELVVIHILSDLVRMQLPVAAQYEVNGLLVDMLRHQPDPLPASSSTTLPSDAIRVGLANLRLEQTPAFEAKIQNLHEAVEGHVGVLLLGPPSSGKTAIYMALAQVYQVLDERLQAFVRRNGNAATSNSVAVQVVAPGAITLNQLYGSIAPTTNTFREGVLSLLLRKQLAAASLQSWLILDGVIDSTWADGFNTLLDDTAAVQLVSGETLPRPLNQRFIFESTDATSASPSIVSRCAVVHIDSNVVTWRTVYSEWINRMPEYLVAIDDVKDALDATVDFVEPALKFIQRHFRSFGLPTTDVSRMRALLSILDASLRVVHGKMVAMTAKQNFTITQCLFLQALVWGIGHTPLHDERVRFDAFLRSLAGEAPANTPSSATLSSQTSRHLALNAKKINMFFPPGRGDLVYSFGLSVEWGVKWELWSDLYSNHCYTPPAVMRGLSDLYVPTPNTACAAYMLDILTQNSSRRNHVLLVGPRGAGKSAVLDVFQAQATLRAKAILDALVPLPSSALVETQPKLPAAAGPPPPSSQYFLKLVFNSWVVPARLIEGLENHLERVRKSSLVAPSGKSLVVVVDDIGLPLVPNGALTDRSCTLECLRHLLGTNSILEPKTLADAAISGYACVASLTLRPSLPHAVGARLASKFTPIALTSILDADLTKMLTGITVWLAQSRNLSLDYTQMVGAIVKASTRLFHAVVEKFRPSPRCPHYVFSISNIVQVLHMSTRACPATMLPNDKTPIIRLWCHEATREIHDRLISTADELTFFTSLRDVCTASFGVTQEALFPTVPAVVPAAPRESMSSGPGRHNSRASRASLDIPPSTSSTTNLLQPNQGPLTAGGMAQFQRLCFSDAVHESGAYVEITDVMTTVQEPVMNILKTLSDTPMRPSSLHLDMDIQTTYALEHIVRLHRLVKGYTPLNSSLEPDHILLLGRSGMGKGTLARLAVALSGASVHYTNLQAPEVQSHAQWRAALTSILVKVVSEHKPSVWIIKDSLLQRPECLQDLCSLVNGMNVVPEFLSPSEVDALAPALRETGKDSDVFLENQTAVQSYCIVQLRQLVKIVLVLTTGAHAQAALQHATTHFDALVHRCRIHIMDNWPDEAYYAIAKCRLDSSDATDVDVKQFTALCLQFRQLAAPFESPSCPITPSRVIYHILSFARQWARHVPRLEARQAKLLKALDTLQFVEKLATDVSTSVSSIEPEIHGVHQLTKSMNVGMHTNTQAILLARRKLEAEEAFRTELESRILADQTRVDGMLGSATEDFLAARRSLLDINMQDVREFIDLEPIPILIKCLYECLGRLLGVEPVEMSDERDENTKWMDFANPTAQRLYDPATLQAFQSHGTDFVAAIKDEVLGPLIPIYDLIEFSPTNLDSFHPVAGIFCGWIRAMLHYKQTIVLLKPQLKHLQVERANLAAAVEKCATLHRALHDQTTSMEEAKAARNQADIQLRDLMAKLTDHSTVMEKANVVLAATNVFVGGWKDEVDMIETSMKHLQGDLLIATGVLEYAGHLTSFGRRQLVLKLVHELKKHSVATSESLVSHARGQLLSDLLLDASALQRWLAQGVTDDLLCRENIALMASEQLTPLVVDPHRIAYNWILSKEMNESKTPLVLWPTPDTSLEESMYAALQDDRPVVVPTINELVKTITLPVLLARRQNTLHGSRVPNFLSVQTSLIPFRSSWPLYLFTTDANAVALPLFASLVHVVHIELTPRICGDLFRAEVVCHSSKHTAHHWKELRLALVDSLDDARRYENYCLDALATAQSEDTIFAESIHLFQWRAAHTDAVDRSDHIQDELDQDQNLPFAMDAVTQRFIDVCLAYDDVANLNRFYSWSISLLMALLTHVLDAVGRDDAVRLRDAFSEKALCLLLKNIFPVDRGVASFLFALRLHHTCTFHVCNDAKVDEKDANEAIENCPEPEGAEDIKEDAVETTQVDESNYILPAIPSFRFLVNPLEHPTQFLSITCPSWIPTPAWDAFTALCFALPASTRHAITQSFRGATKTAWQMFVQARDTTTVELPVDSLSPLERLCIVRVLRPDQLYAEMIHFTKTVFPALEAASAWSMANTASMSSCRHPIVVVATPGADGAENIRSAATRNKADVMVVSWQTSGPTEELETILAGAARTGQWVVLRHAEAHTSWIATVYKFFTTMDLTTLHWDFRVWLCVQDPTLLPLELTQIAIKRVQECSAALHDQLVSALPISNASHATATREPTIDSDVIRRCFLHAFIVGRSQFGRLGWKFPLDSDPNDLQALISGNFDTISHVYGPKIVSTWDAELLKAIVAEWSSPGWHRADWTKLLADVVGPKPLVASTIPEDVLERVTTVDNPDWFGISHHADTSLHETKSRETVASLLLGFQPWIERQIPLPPLVLDGASIVRAEVHQYIAFEKALEAIQLDVVNSKCAVHYDSPLHAVAQREIAAFRQIRRELIESLVQLQEHLLDGAVMPHDLATVHASVQLNLTPLSWLALAKSTQTSFELFQAHLLQQMQYFESWSVNGMPNSHWIGAFLNPKHFFMALKMHFSRSTGIALQAIGVKTTIVAGNDETPSSTLPSIVVSGLQLVGVGWETDNSTGINDNKLVASMASPLSSPLVLRFSAFVVTEFDGVVGDNDVRSTSGQPLPIVQEMVLCNAAPKTVTSLATPWYEHLPTRADVVGVAYLATTMSSADLRQRGAYISIG
ncbi:unnamed protein product [Aphanomyces euteiches]